MTRSMARAQTRTDTRAREQHTRSPLPFSNSIAREAPTAPRGHRLVPAGEDLFRVVDPTGRIIGHLRVLGADSGHRYRAQRYHSPSGRFRCVGDFWSAYDAVESLRSGA